MERRAKHCSGLYAKQYLSASDVVKWQPVAAKLNAVSVAEELKRATKRHHNIRERNIAVTSLHYKAWKLSRINGDSAAAQLASHWSTAEITKILTMRRKMENKTRSREKEQQEKIENGWNLLDIGYIQL
ncbi:Hypothetical predicted protein [Octopus vulgaris]|uniref:Uncharacterized protein n=1 Tax=Octopus vulgaris TaxID=6645 RepID=A0AA36AI44_OCTVU|nr:Hypothetical predicted protein [Octopus vulgaris]